MTIQPSCPVCGGSEFADYNTREQAQCTGCKSLERTRFLWLLLNKLDVLQPGIRVLHVAPEECLMDALGRVASLYIPCDFEPSSYRREVQFIDLCHDLSNYGDKDFDLIIHNHVLEHVQCEVAPVLRELDRILRSGGSQFFSVPFRGDITDEDLDPDLPPSERRRRFGQEDHMRVFGRSEFIGLITAEYGNDPVTWTWKAHVTPQEVGAARVPKHVVDKLSGHTIFRYQKP